MERFDDFFFLWAWGIVLDFGKADFEECFVLFICLKFCFIGDGVPFGVGNEDWIEWMGADVGVWVLELGLVTRCPTLGVEGEAYGFFVVMPGIVLVLGGI